MKVLVLAAGYAVRLQPLTSSTPKPLLPIAGRKMIDRIVDKVLKLKGVDSIYIVTNGKFFEDFVKWLEGSEHKDKISLINDKTTSNETRLGAIRDLELAVSEKRVNDDMLVVAGDNLFELDLNEFVDWASSRRDGVSIAAYDIRRLESARNFGVVKVDSDSRIVDFDEKPKEPRSTLISTGIYYFPKEKISLLENYVRSKGKKMDAPGYYLSWLSRSDKVYGFTFKESWYDIGDMESYEKADRYYSKKER
ncbi:MAG: hypothetical protein A2987_01010 [Omnitrophica bacterium RIFCSPLOWO2_01_FULL_45_10]|nr:MAG: hypothetical protein A2987_01010 [Omnitrophica bacterium RIFCSPLOWO2_01_FULL_45_10]